MRVAYLYQAYSDSLRATALAHPDHAQWDWPRYKAHIDRVNYYYAGYERCHAALGNPCLTAPVNANSYLQRWALHLGLDPSGTAEDLTLRLLAQHQPEVLMCSAVQLRLIRRLRSELPSLRLLLTPANSPGLPIEALRASDGVVSCIPEVAQRLRSDGLRAEHIHHGFATHVLEAVGPPPQQVSTELLFAGGIFRGSDFHLERERLLLRLVRQVPMAILSPAQAGLSAQAQRRLWLRRLAYVGSYPLRWLPPLRRALATTPLLGEALSLPEYPPDSVHPELFPRLQPARYGIDMFERLRQSQVVLNTHIDLSPQSASNMRLFEATGIGACLLTDAKSNLGELFTPDSEVVAYTSAEDCAQRARWLLNHPAECAAIGQRAQARVLRDHTQLQRVGEFMALAERWLARTH